MFDLIAGGGSESASVTGGPMVITTGSRDIASRRRSVALATSVMVLPPRRLSWPDPEKLDPTVVRVP